MDGLIDVVAAVIVRDGLVLCAQRGPDGRQPGDWEFPGGKIEPGESPRQALRREIEEELNCLVAVGDEVATTVHAYDFGAVRLATFWCRLSSGEPRPIEHTRLSWLAPGELATLTWAPADLPAVESVVRALPAGRTAPLSSARAGAERSS